jgi:hypothetical protein
MENQRQQTRLNLILKVIHTKSCKKNMYATLIESKMKIVIELQLSEQQMGFTRNRACTDVFLHLDS